MRLADANPGDILQDRDGAVWLRGSEAAVCLHDPADMRGGDRSSLAADPMVIEEAEKFGSFVRLVPETEAARLQAELDALRAIVESGRDLDDETVAGVQAARDDLRGLAGKGAT